MFRFAQRLAQILDVKPEERGQLDRYDLELEDAISSPFTAVTSKIPNAPLPGQMVFWLDEGNDQLIVAVTYSDGTSTKAGAIILS